MRKQIVSLYFGRDVRTRLGVAIWVTCLLHKGVGIPLSALPMTQQANLPACSPQPPLNAERQAQKQQIPFFKVFWYDSTRD